MRLAARTLLVAAILLTPALVLAAESITTGFISTSGGYTGGLFGGGFGFGGGSCAGSNLACIGQLIINIINRVLVPVLFAVAFIVFLYGVAKAYIFSIGDEEGVKKGHSLILWGLIGFVVMISLWGLVNIVANTFGLFGGGTIAPPSSPYTAN